MKWIQFHSKLWRYCDYLHWEWGYVFRVADRKHSGREYHPVFTNGRSHAWCSTLAEAKAAVEREYARMKEQHG
jgi:hypothetical protein